MSDATLVTLGGAAGAIVTAIFTGVVLVINTWHKNKQEARATAFSEQGAIIDRLEKQNARQERQIQEQQAAITAIQTQHTQCREEAAELRAALAILYAALQKAGIAIELPPELATIRARVALAETTASEFVARSTETNTTLLASVDEQLRKEGGGHENPGGR